MNWLTSAVLFAQNEPVPSSGSSLVNLIPAMVVIFIIFFFLFVQPERKKQKAHTELLTALKKNDRVVTIGGIYGVVSSVVREKDEVVLKVDEANNTKLTVTFNSIARVLNGVEKSSKS